MDEVAVLVEKVMPVKQSQRVAQEDGEDEPQRLFRRAQRRRQLVKAQILDTRPQPPHLLQRLSHVPVRCRRHLNCGRPPGTPSSAPRMWAERWERK